MSTTIKVSSETRDRVRALSVRAHQTAEEVIIRALNELERRERRERMRTEALALIDDPGELAEIQAIHDDMEHLRAW